MWLSGYFAGAAAAAPSSIPAFQNNLLGGAARARSIRLPARPRRSLTSRRPPRGAVPSLTIISASHTGNGRKISEKLLAAVQAAGRAGAHDQGRRLPAARDRQGKTAVRGHQHARRRRSAGRSARSVRIPRHQARAAAARAAVLGAGARRLQLSQVLRSRPRGRRTSRQARRQAPAAARRLRRGFRKAGADLGGRRAGARARCGRQAQARGWRCLRSRRSGRCAGAGRRGTHTRAAGHGRSAGQPAHRRPRRIARSAPCRAQRSRASATSTSRATRWASCIAIRTRPSTPCSRPPSSMPAPASRTMARRTRCSSGCATSASSRASRGRCWCRWPKQAKVDISELLGQRAAMAKLTATCQVSDVLASYPAEWTPDGAGRSAASGHRPRVFDRLEPRRGGR